MSGLNAMWLQRYDVVDVIDVIAVIAVIDVVDDSKRSSIEFLPFNIGKILVCI